MKKNSETIKSIEPAPERRREPTSAEANLRWLSEAQEFLNLIKDDRLKAKWSLSRQLKTTSS